MSQKPIYSWKRAPFIRMLVPLSAGIVLQFNTNLPIAISCVFVGLTCAGLYAFSYIRSRVQFKWYWIGGVLIQLFFFFTGCVLLHYHDVSKHPAFIGNRYTGSQYIVAKLEEPLSEKPQSFKSLVSAQYVLDSGRIKKVKGNIIIYFHKTESIQQLDYGSYIIITKPLQPIRNSGNPGSFDYERYCHFQDIYYQAYLDSSSFQIISWQQKNLFSNWLFNCRKKIVAIIQKHIKGEKEAGLAEALLIGYKDDLDKTLVQSYSNTGVVHVVAISGLHLGLIYWLLSLILKPLNHKKSLRWLQFLLFISGLWLFSLLAGGGPSVIRSAVMFSFIVIAKGFSKKSAILNSLAASAFLLLCFNPYWIWDIGFQLSYLAVWSLVIFMQPIYRLMILQNKILDFIWQLNAVTLSAQILTLPVSVYYFHQFPNMFLITNMVAVPLSSIIVIGEILLCSFFFISFFAEYCGIILNHLIALMNRFVLNMESMPFALWRGLQINFNQLLLLYIAIAFFSGWLLYKNKKLFLPSLLCLLAFVCIRFWSQWNSYGQQQLIVYNTGRYTAIDFIDGRKIFFLADTGLINNRNMFGFQVTPSRLLFRIQFIAGINEKIKNSVFDFGNKKILLADRNFFIEQKSSPDLLILINNTGIKPDDILENTSCKQVIADASISRAKILRWKRACQEKNIPFYSVAEQGAFVLRIN